MSGSPLSPKLPTVALQRRKSFATVRDGGRIETPETCAFNIHSVYLSLSIICSQYHMSKVIVNIDIQDSVHIEGTGL